MSVYVSFGDGPGDLLASNKGWGDFCRWADGLNARESLRVVQLRSLGYAAGVGELADELESAAAAHPPEADGLPATIANLLSLLRANAGEEAVFATDGMTK